MAPSTVENLASAERWAKQNITNDTLCIFLRQRALRRLHDALMIYDSWKVFDVCFVYAFVI